MGGREDSGEVHQKFVQMGERRTHTLKRTHTHTGPLNPPHIPQQKNTHGVIAPFVSLGSLPPPVFPLVPTSTSRISHLVPTPPFSHLSPRPPLRFLAFAAARVTAGEEMFRRSVWNAQQNMSLDREVQKRQPSPRRG